MSIVNKALIGTAGAGFVGVAVTLGHMCLVDKPLEEVDIRLVKYADGKNTLSPEQCRRFIFDNFDGDKNRLISDRKFDEVIKYANSLPRIYRNTGVIRDGLLKALREMPYDLKPIQGESLEELQKRINKALNKLPKIETPRYF